MYADSTEHYYQQLLNSAYYMNAIQKKDKYLQLHAHNLHSN